jgi:hypothetical protein
MQDPFFNGCLLNLGPYYVQKIYIYIYFFFIFFQFFNHHYKDPKAFLSYKQPFIECGLPQCLDGIFILFDRARMKCLPKKIDFQFMPCRILRKKKTKGISSLLSSQIPY